MDKITTILIILIFSVSLSAQDTEVIVNLTTEQNGPEFIDIVTCSVRSTSVETLTAESYGIHIGFQSQLAEFVSSENLSSQFNVVPPGDVVDAAGMGAGQQYDQFASAGASAFFVTGPTIPSMNEPPLDIVTFRFRRLGNSDDLNRRLAEGDYGGYIYAYPTPESPRPAGAIITTSGNDDSYVVTGGARQLVPVEYTFFRGKKDDSYSVLEWETSSEVSNDFFDVERSSNGKNFEKIGQVQGNGTTNEIQNYEFLDRTPHAGLNYYRLKQVDFNGEYDYSNVVTVDFRDGTEGDITIFPNPATDFVNIGLDRKYDGVKVTNQLGQLVEVVPPSNFENNNIKLNVAGYAPGVYFLEAKLGAEIVNKQFVKIK